MGNYPHWRCLLTLRVFKPPRVLFVSPLPSGLNNLLLDCKEGGPTPLATLSGHCYRCVGTCKVGFINVSQPTHGSSSIPQPAMSKPIHPHRSSSPEDTRSPSHEAFLDFDSLGSRSGGGAEGRTQVHNVLAYYLGPEPRDQTLRIHVFPL